MPSAKTEPKADAKEKPAKDATKIVVNGKPSATDKPANGESMAKQRFAAHRKFAQNCQQFAINTKPVDFKEKQSATNKLSATIKQQAVPLNTDLFSNVKLSTDEFLTFLCFRDYVSLPFSLTDRELHVEKDAAKFETRKENADRLTGNDKDSIAGSSKTRETFKENKKKLNGSKIKQEDAADVKINGKANKPNPSKSNGNAKSLGKLANGKLNGKLSSAKLNQIKSQLKNGPAKVGQMKSQKLAKLAKLNRVKNVDKKAASEPQPSLKPGKKKLDIKIELSGSKFSDNKPTNKPLVSEAIKSPVKKPKESIKKKTQPSQTSKKGEKKPSSDKASAKLIKLFDKPKKEFNKAKKEEVKAKKQFMDTRKLRNGSIHHYKGKQ